MSWPEIISLLGGGSLLSAALGWWFNWLAHRRHYRQTLEDKMIERITALNEKYHVHVWRSSKLLGTWLLRDELEEDRALRLCYWSLVAYLHEVDRLRQERPEPLLLDLNEANRYLHEMNIISSNLPFDLYEEASLLDLFRRSGTDPLPPHRFLDLIAKESSLSTSFDRFVSWYKDCDCSEDPAAICARHKVARACITLSEILAAQNYLLHSHWRRESLRRRVYKRLQRTWLRLGLMVRIRSLVRTGRPSTR